MTVGEMMADARGAAGLSVDEVSERTRIRETVIRSIEQDDFDALGGDLYVRGYLRAIAGVVGIDPQPLIREFDAARSTREGADAGEGPPGAEPAVADQDVDWPAVAGEAPAPDDQPECPDQPALLDPLALLDQPAFTGQPAFTDEPTHPGQPAFGDESLVAGQFPTRVDQPAFFDRPITEDYPTLADQPAIIDEPTAAAPWGAMSWNPRAWDSDSQSSDDYHPFWADDAVSDADPFPVAQAAFAEPTVAITAAERVTSGRRRSSAGASRPPARPARRSRVRGWRWVTVISVLAVVVLGVVGVASGQIVAKLRHTDAQPGATPTVTPTVVVEPTTAPPSPTPTPTPAPTQAPPPVRQLVVSSAAAYGPAGTADGDHAEKAWNVIARHPAQPWQTDWYATPAFGMLKSGTGLLLDMGRPVTITSLRIQLGSASGANLQVRVGDEPVISKMPTAVSARDASGPWTLRLVKPARARYVIIWFTKLPPFAVGQFRASVYSVTVDGRP